MEVKTTSDVISVVDARAALISTEQNELTRLHPLDVTLIYDEDLETPWKRTTVTQKN